ncbi:MAG: FG-GAP-like repeat-containing protein [Myxococcota bacterium]
MRAIPLALLLLTTATAQAMTVEEIANPHAHALDRLQNLGLVRGQRHRVHPLQVNAGAGESWTLETVNLPGARVTPSSGTGNQLVELALDGNAAADLLQGAVVLKHGSGAVQQQLSVNATIWPPQGANPTRDELRVRTGWPQDPDYGELWDLWGFLPDDVSHPGANLPEIESWERTACPDGQSGANCTAEGQAGLAAGMSADRAWRLTTGDRRVTLAVLDSGMNWSHRDLLEQVRVNVDELVACPPLGASPVDLASYDVNKDGWVNIRDYDHTEVADWNGNGRKDVQDLIHGTVDGRACSDGIDDDGNGYVDDIAGWDFFWDDNDAGDDVDFGHGEFEARLSAGQAHNGTGGLGVCPTCSFIPLRVGDSFIVDVNRYAEAVVYAVDNGCSAVQQALGGLSNTPTMNKAVDYAYNNGVPVVAAASDLLSYHHNWPANADHAFMVHAIVYNGLSNLGGAASWRDAETFLNFNNCTNYGAKLMLSSPGEGCSSEATAKTSGQVGLIKSHWLRLRERFPDDPYYARDLSAEEIYQVLTQSADDIDVPGAETDEGALAKGKYASNEGWDEHFGYGRNNAYRALKMLEDKRVPPEVELTAPGWFEMARVRDGATVEVRGRVQNRRSDAQACFTVRWAPGVAPSEGELGQHVLSQGCVNAGPQPVKSFSDALTASDLFAALPQGDVRTRDDRTITVELRVTANAPGGEVTGVARRSFFVEQDDSLLPSFPRYLAASGESSPRFVDVDDDGKDELLVATSDGKVHLMNAKGSELPGFPVTLMRTQATCGGTVVRHGAAPGVQAGGIPTEAGSAIVSSPAVAKLDGPDAPPSIIVATTFGALFVVDAAGELRTGFPVCLDEAAMAEVKSNHKFPDRKRRAEMGFLSSPTAFDLEDDGVVDIAIGGGDGQLHVWLPDGKVKPGFPVMLSHPAFVDTDKYGDRVVSSPTVADIDGDGVFELVIGSNERFENVAQSAIYAVHHDGNNHAGGAYLDTRDERGDLVWPQSVNMFTPEELLPTIGRGHPTSVAAADMDGDGKDEIFTAGLGGWVRIYNEKGLHPAIPDGMLFSAGDFGPQSNSQESAVLTMINSPSVADINNDGKIDVIDGMVGVGIAGLVSQGGERIQFDHVVGAWDAATGTFHDGFPAVVEDFQILMNYPVADVDGDGQPEVVVATAGYFIHAIRADGTKPEGWPKLTGGFTLATPTLGDIDGDGTLEMAAITRNGYLFVWALGGPKDSVQWGGFKHDRWNTGNLRFKPDTAEAAPLDCGCRSVDGTPPLMALAFMALLLRVRRRR